MKRHKKARMQRVEQRDEAGGMVKRSAAMPAPDTAGLGHATLFKSYPHRLDYARGSNGVTRAKNP